MNGLNKPIYETNYKNKNKKKKKTTTITTKLITIRSLSKFCSSSHHIERRTPFDGRGEEEEEVKAPGWIW